MTARLLDGALSLVLSPLVRLLQIVDDARDTESDDPCAGGTCAHQWETSTEDGGDNVHVLPLLDAVHHAHSEDCVCGPRTEPVFRPDGSNGWLYVHHSLDAREAAE